MRSKNFNPRTHRGVRLRNDCKTGARKYISIHAPIVGCDLLFHQGKHGQNQDFNPRTHRGVRQQRNGAEIYSRYISIHAPIVGCDLINVTTATSLMNFNPRTHRGVRPKEVCEKIVSLEFQSTHPSWGATK